jgi:hypothetical protein
MSAPSGYAGCGKLNSANEGQSPEKACPAADFYRFMEFAIDFPNRWLVIANSRAAISALSPVSLCNAL